jgi:hypothetical protein
VDRRSPNPSCTRARASLLVKNEVEFRLYNKFGAEATIQFGDTPEPLPEENTKEEPVK